MQDIGSRVMTAVHHRPVHQYLNSFRYLPDVFLTA